MSPPFVRFSVYGPCIYPCTEAPYATMPDQPAAPDKLPLELMTTRCTRAVKRLVVDIAKSQGTSPSKMHHLLLRESLQARGFDLDAMDLAEDLAAENEWRERFGLELLTPESIAAEQVQ